MPFDMESEQKGRCMHTGEWWAMVGRLGGGRVQYKFTL